MGYTHYYETDKVIPQKKWNNFTKDVKILLKDNDLIQREYNESKPPEINKDHILFNGIGGNGHETFYLPRKNEGNYCKTANKPYDVCVTATLLLAHMHLDDKIKLASDGDVEDWQEGVKMINDKLEVHITLTENPDAFKPKSIKTALFTCETLKDREEQAEKEEKKTVTRNENEETINRVNDLYSSI